MTDNLLKNPLLKVIDSSKLKAYHSCPRKFFFSYVLGWRSVEPSHDLVFGTAMHEALEYVYTVHKHHGLDKAYSRVTAIRAWEKFITTYRQTFPESTDEEVGPKNPKNFMLALLDYMTYYKGEDNFQVDYVEASGMVPIAEDRQIFFRLDTVCTANSGVHFVLEHKSSKWALDRWAESFAQAIQIGTCLHALQCLYEGPVEVKLNGIFFRPEPKYKKNGEPYANSSKGNEFYRPSYSWSNAKMSSWLYTVNHYYSQIFQQYDELSKGDVVQKPALECFPINPSACFEYNRKCPYADYCTSWPNPLQHCSSCPTEFKVEHWDPRAGDKTYKPGEEKEDG